MRHACFVIVLLAISGCAGGDSSYEDPRPALATMPAATRANILGIVDSTKSMSAGEATAFIEEQIPTFEEYAANTESPYADLYQQILEQAKSAASGNDVGGSLKEIKDLAGQLPTENP
ncbi:hypothetical protein AB1K70_19455 [Bremerella sp. JC770]|uniref:hypothetical protein n=1 Tax=Bremerella sp. JC770 TaxID=3232137 RepID=UPI00345A858C